MTYKADLTIISGGKNAGKTRLCLLLIENLKEEDTEVKGVLSPGLYQDGRKIGILVRDIASGEEKIMANYDPGWDAEVPSREWRFDMKAVEWGNQCLKQAVPTKVLMIDELGYLELEQNRGWTAGLQALDSGQYNHAVVVVRPDLLETARKRWKQTYFIAVTENDNVKVLAQMILDHLRESA